ncbi:MAG: hypothetical protein DCF22_16010 [Leptolyngbya sp.]|nr:MAG: hypothetical protein DCF22_16010 [Leptolyngbya sp.]
MKFHRIQGLGAMVAIALLIAGSGCTARRTAERGNAPPASPATLALADHLNQQGAKLYTTYWCPYCQRQQALFGSAVAKLQVLECDPKGDNAHPEQCAQVQVSSYPTWQMNGQLYRGLRSREELALISGYQGSQQFEK